MISYLYALYLNFQSNTNFTYLVQKVFALIVFVSNRRYVFLQEKYLLGTAFLSCHAAWSRATKSEIEFLFGEGWKWKVAMRNAAARTFAMDQRYRCSRQAHIRL